MCVCFLSLLRGVCVIVDIVLFYWDPSVLSPPLLFVVLYAVVVLQQLVVQLLCSSGGVDPGCRAIGQQLGHGLFLLVSSSCGWDCGGGVLRRCVAPVVVGKGSSVPPLVLDVNPLVAHGARVLDVEPLPQAQCVEVVVARRDASRAHELLVADGAHVLDVPQLITAQLRQRVDLLDGGAAVDEGLPAVLGLQVDVEVGVQAHHAGADLAARLEHHGVGAVPEHDDAEQELNDVASGAHIIDVVV